MDARRIPVENAFDLIGAFDVIEHIAEDEDVLLAIRQALKPGGSVVISVPQHPWLWSQADGLALHQRRYRRGELEEKLRRTGFEIRFSSSYTAALFPVMALSRLKSRFFPGRGTDDVNREETVGRSVNNAFTRLLGIEVALTLRGMRWPFGGSRVVVATLR
jgi:SAM-dependent methyltransferase